VALTVKKVTKLMDAGTPGKYRDAGGVRGFHLVVVNDKNASWQFRYQLYGKPRWMGLGSARDVPLAEAREQAEEARRLLAKKIDPLTIRRDERATQKLASLRTITFSEAARSFVRQHEAGWRNVKHAKQVISTLEQYAFPIIGNLPVAAVDTPAVLKVLQPIWNEKTETASRLRGRIESVLGWATVSGFRSGDNPARWTSHLDQALPAPSKVAKVEHHAALPYGDVPAFMDKLKDREGTAAQALMFTILTAARTGETIGARWSEVDLDKATWTIPAERMKAGKTHVVPLAPQVLELLRALPHEDSDYIFIGGGRPGAGLSNMAMTAVLKRLGHGHITVHGFRSAFKDFTAERTNFPNEVSEMALAHKVSDKVEAAYRRGSLLEKRRKLMEAWAAFCSTPVKAKGDVVVPIRAQ
jgi:integrase